MDSSADSGSGPTPAVPSDPWLHLRRYTSARIALGRAGGSLPTAARLDFAFAHALARDAVLATFHADNLMEVLAAAGIPCVRLHTAATDKPGYLLRPDLGRRLSAGSRTVLQNGAGGAKPDLVIIVSDGLSATAAERHAAAVLVPLVAKLQPAGWRIAPVFVVPFARVRLQDELGALTGAAFTLMLLGERPGLGSPDSLGAYFTAAPGAMRTDADRNCVSNIRPEGLPPEAAAAKLARLLETSRRTGLSGLALKEDREATALGDPNPHLSAAANTEAGVTAPI